MSKRTMGRTYSLSRRGSRVRSAVTSSTVAAFVVGFTPRTLETVVPRGRRVDSCSRAARADGGGTVGASERSRAFFGTGPLRCGGPLFGRFAFGLVSGSGGSGFRCGIRVGLGCGVTSRAGQTTRRRSILCAMGPSREANPVNLPWQHRWQKPSNPPYCMSRRRGGGKSPSSGAPTRSGASGALESVCQ